MIYVKTNMKEMPKGCGKCDLSYPDNTDPGGYVNCEAKLKIFGNDRRPDWCPLVEFKEESNGCYVIVDEHKQKHAVLANKFEIVTDGEICEKCMGEE